MKHNKTLGILSVALVLGLVGCTGKGETSTKSNAKTSKTSKPSVSTLPPEPVKEAYIDGAVIAKVDTKVVITVTGTYDLYQQGELKLAWGLLGDNQQWGYGSDTPAETDYQAVTLNATAKTWEMKINVTDVQGIPAANYTFYAGTNDEENSAYDVVALDASELGSVTDGTYRYYYRDDISAVAIEVLPPVTLSSATVVDYTPEGGTAGKYLKVGGAKNATVTAEAIATWSPYCDFEPVPYASAVRLTNNETMFLTIDGDNFWAYFSLAGLSAGTNYLVHFNHNGTKANCFTTGKIEDVEYKDEANGLVYTIYSNPEAGQAGGEGEFYGCLAVKVTAAE